MQTFTVFVIGSAYGLRLGVSTVIAYLLLGAIGFDVFTASTSTNKGLDYMLGGTGGYLLGFAAAAAVLGHLASRGWDRSVVSMAGALVIGQLFIYAPGILWLGHLYADAKGWGWVLDAGLWPFLFGDALKVALAALLVPSAWKLAGKVRA